MKRSVFKLMIVAGLALAGEMASAEVLYWRVGNPLIYQNSNKNPAKRKSASQMGLDQARVAVGEYKSFEKEDGTIEQRFVASDYLELVEYDDFGEEFYSLGTSVTTVDNGMAGPLWADLGDYASDTYSFQLQLGVLKNGAFDMQAMTDTVTYGDLAQYISGNEYFAQLTKPWTGKNYIVPEPTGGLLFLLGCVVLGLKRKTEVA